MSARARASQGRFAAVTSLSESHERFASNVRVLVSTNVLGQLVYFGTLPLISRLFDASEFGLLTVFLSFLRLFTAGTFLRVDWSIPNVTTESALGAMVSLALLASVLTVPFASGAVLLAPRAIELYSSSAADSLREIGFWIPLAVVLGSIVFVLQAVFVSANDLRAPAHGRLVQAVITAAGSLAIGWLSDYRFGLVAALVMGYVGNAGVLGYRALRFLWRALRAPHLFATVLSVGGHFKAEFASSYLVSVANALTTSVVPVMVLSLYGEEEAGLYGFAYSLVLGPIAIVTSAVASSFWSEAADLANSHRLDALTGLYRRTLWILTGLVAVLLVPYVIGAFAAPYVFGSGQWEQLTEYALAMFPAFLATVVFGTTNHLVVYRKQHFQAITDVVGFLLIVGSIVTVHRSGGSAVSATLAASIASLAGYLLRCGLHLYANQLAQREARV